MKKLDKVQVEGQVMNTLGMIWLVIGQRYLGYTNRGTRRQTQKATTERDLAENQNTEREHLGLKA